MINKADIQYLERKRREIIDNCPVCHGKSPFCRCNYAFKDEIGKASAGIPIPYRDFTLAKLVHPQLVAQKRALETFLSEMDTRTYHSAIIAGGEGLGKTAVACAMLMKMISLREKCYYYPTLRSYIVAVMDASLGKNYEDPAVIAAKSATGIVIDGLGYGFPQEQNASTDMAYAKLVQRFNYGYPTFFVSGVPMQMLGPCEQMLVRAVHPIVFDFKGFNYVKEVLEPAGIVPPPSHKKTPTKKTVKKTTKKGKKK